MLLQAMQRWGNQSLVLPLQGVPDPPLSSAKARLCRIIHLICAAQSGSAAGTASGWRRRCLRGSTAMTGSKAGRGAIGVALCSGTTAGG